MKKFIGSILCLVIVVAGIAFLMQSKRFAPHQYAHYLPPQVIALVNISQANTLIDAFGTSPLGHFLAKESIRVINQEAGGKVEDTAQYDRFCDTVAEITQHQAFRAIFGEDATLVLWQPDMKHFTATPGKALKQSLVVVAKSGAAGTLDTLSGLIKNAQFSKETVDGLNLIKYSAKDKMNIYIATEGDIVLFALSTGAIKTCLAANSTGDNLSKVPGFQEATAFWQAQSQAKGSSRLYLDSPRLAALLKASSNVETKKSGEMLQGWGTLFAIDALTEQGLECRGQIAWQYDQVHSLIKGMVDVASVNRTQHLLQANTLAYNWASSPWVDIIIQAIAPNDTLYRQLDKESQQNLKVSLADLTRSLGPQHGGVLEDIDRTPFLPVPKMTFFTEVRDHAVADTLVTSLRQEIEKKGIAKIEQEQVAGQTLYSWVGPFGKIFQPALLLTDSMLYCATSKQSLKEMLLAQANPSALAAPVAAQLGPELSGRLSTANFSSFVLYPKRMSGQTIEVLEWVVDIMGATKKKVSLKRFNQELGQVMQATELLAISSNTSKERLEWAVTARKAAPEAAEKSGK
jgi:hypothetical protein